MRSHDECEEAINEALARGHEGYAEFLATRCDRIHGPQDDPASATRAAPTTTKETR